MTKPAGAFIICFIAVILGGYVFATFVPTLVTKTVPAVSESTTTRVPPKGQKEYRNERYVFSLYYPEAMEVKEFEEGNGASTFVFEHAAEGLGFQIFVAPYGEEKISNARFLQDSPSGIREHPSTFYLDQALGTSFYSKSLVLGETYEIWFTRNGFLYEVTTLKALDKWLNSILQSWQFTSG